MKRFFNKAIKKYNSCFSQKREDCYEKLQMTFSDTCFLKKNVRLTSGITRQNRDQHPGFVEEHPKIVGSHQKIVGSHPKIIGSHPKIIGSHLKIVGSHPKIVGSHPKIVEERPKIIGSRPKMAEERYFMIFPCSSTTFPAYFVIFQASSVIFPGLPTIFPCYFIISACRPAGLACRYMILLSPSMIFPGFRMKLGINTGHFLFSVALVYYQGVEFISKNCFAAIVQSIFITEDIQLTISFTLKINYYESFINICNLPVIWCCFS